MSDYLCEELIVEIFTRLPPKSLLRFRSLSKSWYSCISSPSFMHKHTFRSPQKFLIKRIVDQPKRFGYKELYTLHSEDRLPLYPRRCSSKPLAEFTVYYKISDIVGSCNGILCLLEYIHDYKEIRISLLNPSIRRELTLPACPRHWPACTRQRCSHIVGTGFGFDPTTDDYKIVSLFCTRCEETKQNSFVYATKIGKWCAIASPKTLFSFVTRKAFFLNGALRWVVERKSGDGDLFYILTFDLSIHAFGMIALPEYGDSWIWRESQLTNIQGSLAVCGDKYEDRLIWVRRDESWSLDFELKTKQIDDRVLRVVVHGDTSLYMNFKAIEVYSHKRGAESILVNCKSATLISDVVLFSESLELLDGDCF